jgi:hypothetical protein
MRTCRGVEVSLTYCWCRHKIDVCMYVYGVDHRMWVVSFTPQPLYPRGKSPLHPLNSWVLEIVWTLWSREKSLASIWNRTPAVQPLAHRYIDWAIQASDRYIEKRNWCPHPNWHIWESTNFYGKKHNVPCMYIKCIPYCEAYTRVCVCVREREIRLLASHPCHNVSEFALIFPIIKEYFQEI